MTEYKNDAMFACGAGERCARVHQPVEGIGASFYGLSRGTDSTAPLDDMNVMKCKHIRKQITYGSFLGFSTYLKNSILHTACINK